MRIILTLLLLSAPVLSACQGERDSVYAGALKCAEAVSKGGDCPPRQEPPANEARPNGADDGAAAGGAPQPIVPALATRVYIDASESMKGFAGAPDNSFVKVIETLGYAMPGCRLYKYGFNGTHKTDAGGGQAAYAQEIRFSQDLRRPTFYDLGFNEDDVLIKHLAEEDPPARSVLLTDGVYSARNTELQSEVVKAVEQWLDKGRFFGILIFTSAFDGRIYSENERAWTEPVKVSARPFYAFVFSPTEKEFRELKNQLADEVKVEGALAFPPEAVSCTVVPEDKDGLEKKDGPPRHLFYLHMYDASVFGDGGQADFSFDLRCVPSPDYPVASFEPEPELTGYTWQVDSFSKNERPPQFTHSYARGAAPSGTPTPSTEAEGATPTPTAPPRKQPNLRITLGRDVVARYSLYRLSFALSGRSLNPEIRNLSTQDDGLISEAGKTYRFYEFISSLTTMHLQSKRAVAPPPPVFIVVANK